MYWFRRILRYGCPAGAGPAHSICKRSCAPIFHWLWTTWPNPICRAKRPRAAHRPSATSAASRARKRNPAHAVWMPRLGRVLAGSPIRMARPILRSGLRAGRDSLPGPGYRRRHGAVFPGEYSRARSRSITASRAGWSTSAKWSRRWLTSIRRCRSISSTFDFGATTHALVRIAFRARFGARPFWPAAIPSWLARHW